MKRQVLLLTIVLAGLAAMALVPMAAQNPQTPQTQQPPPDPGLAVLNRACTVCHTLGEITKFKGYYTRDQWADVVRTMRADGAVVQDSEVQALVDYLFRTYGKQENSDAEIKKVFEVGCGGCHDLTLATDQRKSRAEWQDTVSRMMDRGAPLDEKQLPALLDYLAKNFGS